MKRGARYARHYPPVFDALSWLIVRILRDHGQLLADAVHLCTRNMICAVRQFGELRCYGDGVLRIIEVRRNSNAL